MVFAFVTYSIKTMNRFFYCRALWSILGITLLIGCVDKKSAPLRDETASVKQENIVDESEGVVARAGYSIATENYGGLENTEPKIVKNATIRCQVSDYKKATERIEEIVKKTGAYFTTQSQTKSETTIENQVVVRVDNTKFEAFVKELSEMAQHVDSKHVYSEDVTAQYINTVARLKVKKETESKFYEILKQAHTVKDALEVQREINTIREEIDAAEGQLKYLEHQISFSVVTVEYYQQIADQNSNSDNSIGTRISQAITNGWHGFLSLIVFAVTLWPFWIVVAVFLFIIIKSAKRMRRQTKSDTLAKD